MRKKQILANIGRFVVEGNNYYYIDNHGNVWSQEMIADLINSYKGFKLVTDCIEHYKKVLR